MVLSYGTVAGTIDSSYCLLSLSRYSIDEIDIHDEQAFLALPIPILVILEWRRSRWRWATACLHLICSIIAQLQLIMEMAQAMHGFGYHGILCWHWWRTWWDVLALIKSWVDGRQIDEEEQSSPAKSVTSCSRFKGTRPGCTYQRGAGDCTLDVQEFG